MRYGWKSTKNFIIDCRSAGNFWTKESTPRTLSIGLSDLHEILDQDHHIIKVVDLHEILDQVHQKNFIITNCRSAARRLKGPVTKNFIIWNCRSVILTKSPKNFIILIVDLHEILDQSPPRNFIIGIVESAGNFGPSPKRTLSLEL
ncbi:hypothetical protein AVEN_269836-1 [Araneus ventricosus]|uniref:Uncharacterized protein n=1 Tax=Araneus ventricosus TaxID=182803 RepID=A0A4Y2CGC4_ARAVE|nr:hypothetical protein AVEN_269836-1 [Araneus ventricosus]